jgi:hypothetical protein
MKKKTNWFSVLTGTIIFALLGSSSIAMARGLYPKATFFMTLYIAFLLTWLCICVAKE